MIFIVAGVNPAAVEETRFNNTPNPIFQLALPYFLEPFDRKGVREMVRTLGRYAGAKFEETVFDHLTEKFGGHPYLIRIACSQVWRELNKNLPQALCEILTLDFIKRHEVIKDRLAQPIKDILLSLVWWYPEEYQLLQMLANGESQFVSDYIKESPGSLLKFAKYGLLKGNNLSSFAIDDLKEFMVQNGDNYKNEISPFLRGDLPPELLPEIPDLGLLSKLFEKRVEIESKLRKVIIFYLGVHNDWDNKKISEKLLQGLRRRSDRKNPASLFMGATPQSVMEELYLLDLKDIITNNWDVFCGLFDQNKSRFEMNMDTINLVRKTESHTGTFTEAEKADYIASCAWIIRHLEKVPNI